MTAATEIRIMPNRKKMAKFLQSIDKASISLLLNKKKLVLKANIPERLAKIGFMVISYPFLSERIHCFQMLS